MNVRTTKITRFLRQVPTKNQERTTTSKRSRGFTLIEVLVVILIIVMIMTMGLPAIQRITYQRVTSQTRKFIGVIRTIRNDAILLSSINRLVLDLDHKTWWVETQQRFQMLAAVTAPEPKKKGKKDQTVGDGDKNFAINDKYSKKPIELPSGVVVSGVLKEGQKVQKDGVAYIHFFPNGYNEEAILYLAKEGNDQDSYSVIIHPTSGKVDVVPGHEEKFE